jgi:hypothetical protein
MGALKPALALGGSTVLECAVACLREAGAVDVVVVTGREADAVAALARRAGARPVHNPRYAEGMFGSMTTGVAALGPEVEAFFVLPADTPLVRPPPAAPWPPPWRRATRTGPCRASLASAGTRPRSRPARPGHPGPDDAQARGACARYSKRRAWP